MAHISRFVILIMDDLWMFVEQIWGGQSSGLLRGACAFAGGVPSHGRSLANLRLISWGGLFTLVKQA